MVLRPGPTITSHAHVESFEILVDKMDKMNLETPSAYTNNARTEAASPSARALGELPVENCQNSGATTANTPLPMATPAPTPAPTATSTSDPQSPHGVPPSGSGKPAAHLVNPEPKFIKAQIDQQALRHQRPALQPQTFEPLSAVAAKQAAGKPKPTNNTTSSAWDKTVTASTRTTNIVKPGKPSCYQHAFTFALNAGRFQLRFGAQLLSFVLSCRSHLTSVTDASLMQITSATR